MVLALASCAPEQPERASLLIEVSRQGRVTLDEIPVTVNELIAATTGRTAETVEVRADPDAIWMHVQWILAALGEAGFAEARCVFHGCPGLGRIGDCIRTNFRRIPRITGARVPSRDLFLEDEAYVIGLNLGINF